MDLFRKITNIKQVLVLNFDSYIMWVVKKKKKKTSKNRDDEQTWCEIVFIEGHGVTCMYIYI